jgi:nucleotide-binding universal stress UspA family protein
MKKILFATDFSSNANKAFCFALNLAEKHQAELIMVHIFDIPTVWTYPSTYNLSEMKMHSISSWERTLEEFFEHYDTDVKTKFVAIEHPSVVQGIISTIEEHKPELVVTGTRGKSALKEAILGGTTKALVKRSPIPVLAVPEYAEQRGYDKVLYASDFQEVDIQAIEKLVQLVKPYKPEIKILHINIDNEFKGREKMEWFKELVHDKIDYKHISFELVSSGNIFQTLYKHMSEHEFELLVMLEKKRDGIIDELFHEDLVTKMEFRTWIPLLSYNDSHLSVSSKLKAKKRDTIEH